MSDKNKNDDPRVTEMKKYLDQVVDAAGDLRDNGYSSLDQATGAAAKGIAEAQKKALDALENLKNDKSRLRGDSADGWKGVQDDFHNFFARSRVKHDENEIARDVKRADEQAKRAIDEADNALSHALDVLQSAKVAVLDAVQSAAYADELKQDLKG